MSTASSSGADRELRAEAVIAATPERVWAVLTDLRHMIAGSPELLAMLPLKPGGLRTGQWYLGVNRRKAVIWPTRSVVCACEPGKTLAWDTPSSGARWIYELAPAGGGTRLIHRRPVPRRLTMASRLVAGALLGGANSHCDELEQGMAATVAALKLAAE